MKTALRYVGFWTVGLGLFLGCAVLMSKCAYAHPFALDDCENLARDTSMSAADRDRGVTYKQLIEEAAVGLSNCRAKYPDCSYKDDQDDLLVTGFIGWLYGAGAKLTPDQVRDYIMQKCQAKVNTLPNGTHPTGPQIQS